jgi:hypothetical protein
MIRLATLCTGKVDHGYVVMRTHDDLETKAKVNSYDRHVVSLAELKFPQFFTYRAVNR